MLILPEVFGVKTATVHFLKSFSRKQENTSCHIRWPLIVFIFVQRDKPFTALVTMWSRIEDKAGEQFYIGWKLNIEIQ